MDFPSEEKAFKVAATLYEEGHYKKAADVFTYLTCKDPFEESYWRGLAGSKQMQKKFEDALHAWCMVAILVEKDAWPHFHAAECFFALRDPDEGKKALNLAEQRLRENDPLHHQIRLLKEHYVLSH